jgi:hypothetical protein
MQDLRQAETQEAVVDHQRHVSQLAKVSQKRARQNVQRLYF